MNILRKTLIAGVALVTLAGSIAAATGPASAKHFGFGSHHGFGFGHHGFGHHGFDHRGFGHGLGGGYDDTAVLDSDYSDGCYVARKPIFDDDGNFAGLRPVRVCD
jgi:hypothetical protein